MWLWVKTNGTFWGRRTTHFRTYFSGDWGYDLAFDPWPCKTAGDADGDGRVGLANAEGEPPSLLSREVSQTSRHPREVRCTVLSENAGCVLFWGPLADGFKGKPKGKPHILLGGPLKSHIHI